MLEKKGEIYMIIPFGFLDGVDNWIGGGSVRCEM